MAGRAGGATSVAVFVTACLAGLVCCGIALPVAHRWAATGDRVASHVTGCAVWYPDEHYRCDYHWSAGGQEWAGRLPGANWPDGHRVNLWMDPHDPAHVTPAKSLVLPLVVLTALALTLVAAAGSVFRLTAAGPRTGDPAAEAGSRATAWARRALGFGGVLAGLAVAAAPGVVLVRTAHRVPVDAPVRTTPAGRGLVLRDVRPVPAALADRLDIACSPRPGQDDRSLIADSTRDETTLRLPARFVVPGIVWSAALSPDRTRLATGGTDGTVRVWDVLTRRVTTTLVGGGWIDSVAFGPDGATLAVADTGTVRLWDLASTTVTATLSRYGVALYSVGLDRTTLTVCDGHSMISRWTVQ
jgi:hypothetical protein